MNLITTNWHADRQVWPGGVSESEFACRGKCRGFSWPIAMYEVEVWVTLEKLSELFRWRGLSSKEQMLHLVEHSRMCLHRCHEQAARHEQGVDVAVVHEP